MFRFGIALKFIILLAGFSCIGVLFQKENMNATGLGIAAAGCLIAFALLENNDVTESNKE